MLERETPYLVRNKVGGIDLMVERDRGNPVLVLTGNQKYSIPFWKKLRRLAEDALIDMGEDYEN
jgi:hypothetical protein